LNTFLFAEFVSTISLETLLGLGFSETIIEITIKLLGDLLKGKSMSRCRHGRVGLARDVRLLFFVLAHFDS